MLTRKANGYSWLPHNGQKGPRKRLKNTKAQGNGRRKAAPSDFRPPHDPLRLPPKIPKKRRPMYRGLFFEISIIFIFSANFYSFSSKHSHFSIILAFLFCFY